MDKQNALMILINHSFLLTDKAKSKLVSKLSGMTDEEIDNLGRFLALEKRKSLETAKQTIDDIDQMLAELQKDKNNNS